ncbi:MAG TPA: ATP-binding protein [Bacteroidota bacterium]|nr:ATP-binding protein [Bacteroidota bacterium]
MTSSPKDKATKKNLRIPSQTEKLVLAREFVANAARVFGFAEDDVNNIALAVDEACTNIIKHAYHYATDKEIDIIISMKRPEFEIVIQDAGNHFDPTRVPVPDMKEYISHYKRGGLGMYLMKKLMDKVEYTKQPRKNTVRLIKYLHQ